MIRTILTLTFGIILGVSSFWGQTQDTTINGVTYSLISPCLWVEVEFNCGGSISFVYRGSTVTYGSVEGQNGSCWLDRNLGADPMPFDPAMDATGNTDSRLYGDQFQWGRGDDGHQDRTSSTTGILSTMDQPGHGDFITSNAGGNWDWRSPQNDSLWQGVDGLNIPCPPGWRIPTEDEWEAELDSWGVDQNATGAFNSPLKLPVSGGRNTLGSPTFVDSYGFYWSSTPASGPIHRSVQLLFHISDASISTSVRGGGQSVRCIKD